MELENNKVGVYVDTDLVIAHYPSRWDSVKDK
jgi:hypothetical protein